MNVITAYLDTMFSAYPVTPRMAEAKTELRGMMEDAYTSLIAQGHTENEAVGQVIRDFGNLEEVAPVLGITSLLSGAEAGPADAVAGAGVTATSPAYPPVTLDEAKAFAAAQRASSRRIAPGVVLFVLSPITLIVATVAAETGHLALSEGAASMLGLLVLLSLVAVGVLLCLAAGRETAPYARLDSGDFSPNPEVTAWAKTHAAVHEPRRSRALQVAIALWILAAVPVLAFSLLTEEWADTDFWSAVGVGLTLAVVATGLAVYLPHTWSSTVAETFADGAPGEARDDDDEDSIVGVIAAFYWPLLTAAFLAWSFLGNAWHISWILWPVGAVLFGAIAGGIGALESYRSSRK
ncbi:MAG: permease prefix domain 1-containing protein [Demequina sp.]|uniref:permease prefix domain 1-containing protein n=1 Tax=Demequina sp. TaxID=2050685 RepID=UPI003A8602A8